MSIKIFFSGIAGSGTSALALFHAKKGYSVSGSDRLFDTNPNHRLKAVFRANNIKIYPQDGSGIVKDTDVFVFSTAIENTNPDLIRAKGLDIKILTRPEILADIVKEYQTIAVAGTSGKSTTSSMLAFLMQEIGLQPNFIGGGRIKHFKHKDDCGNYLVGDSDTLIIEACESDGSIINYYPHSTILLNLDLDHHKIEETKIMFDILIKNTSEHVIFNAEDENLKFINSYPKAKCFSIKKMADYTPKYIKMEGFGSTFTIKGVRFKLSLPGRHNLINALACIAYLSEIGVGLDQIADVIHKFHGIERRFDIYLDDFRGFVIDDYAHNPHKISYLMETVSVMKDNVCYIFQPHGYSPTRLMKDGYIETFCTYLRQGDTLALLPIYYAGGSISKDISSDDIADEIAKRGKSAKTLQSRDEILNMTDTYKNFVVFGARDETLADLAKTIRDRLCSKNT